MSVALVREPAGEYRVEVDGLMIALLARHHDYAWCVSHPADESGAYTMDYFGGFWRARSYAVQRAALWASWVLI